MARLLVFLLVFGFSNSSFAQPIMQFDTTVYDFGEFDEGLIVNHEFTYTNTGDSALIITNVQTSCGCMIAKWAKEPVLPGDSGIIDVYLNSEGRPGKFHKSVVVRTNEPEFSQLFIKGNVISKEN